MDQDPSCPKPLHIRKISGQAHQDRIISKDLANKKNPRIHPPRSSSLFGRPSIECDIPSRGTFEPKNNKSTPSNPKHLAVESQSDIMGNFVPIESIDRPSKATSSEEGHVTFNALYDSRKVTQARNPYEFEPPSPYETVIDSSDVKSQNGISYRPSHVKNSRSEDISAYNTPRISDHGATSSRPIGRAIHRSESSPNLLPLPFLPRRDKTPSTELSQHMGYHQHGYSIRDGPQRVVQQVHRSYDEAERSYSPMRRDFQDSYQSSRSRSPSHLLYEDSAVPSYIPHRSLTRSPTKALDNVSERDERDSISIHYPSSPPKKRSRSPMKKMFGDNGWLGQSPDEKPEQSTRSRKKSSASRSDQSSPHYQKKTTMMGKLKNKLEEFAEKAELTPSRGSRSEREKHPKLLMLSVSLGPPEQARIDMEIELMIVHTANCFLMTQFSQGRIAVDSIKKTVDMWKNKGRPIVIEFMYDQATQRELIAANQHNFRFHGSRVGDEIRINSMLYNWKQVANLMSIRTFCTADTVLLKLLFDIEQILELLGAGEPMMLRLQQLRASANEMMRVARQAKDAKATAQAIPRGQEMVWDAHSPTGSGTQGESMIDPYGGLKLVPDTYTE